MFWRSWVQARELPVFPDFLGFSQNDPVFGLGVQNTFLIALTLLFSYYHLVWRYFLPFLTASLLVIADFFRKSAVLFRMLLHFSRLTSYRMSESFRS